MLLDDGNRIIIPQGNFKFSAGEPSTKIAQDSFTKEDQMDSKFADLSVLAIKVSTKKVNDHQASTGPSCFGGGLD